MDSKRKAGPDQVIDATSYTTWSCKEGVKLLMSQQGVGSLPPVSIVTVFRNAVEKYPDNIALVDNYNDTSETTNYREYYNQVVHVAKAFIKLGLEAGCGVGIIGFNSPQWFISHLASIFAGGLSAGIYTTNSPETCKFICNDARCNIIVVEDDVQLKKIIEVEKDLPNLKAIIQYRGVPIIQRSNLYHWAEVMKMKVDDYDNDLQERINNIACNKCATLIYTSGTTGDPKGTMLSHDNLTWSVKLLIDHTRKNYPTDPNDDQSINTDVSYLPLSHLAGLVLGVYWPIMDGGGTIYFAKPDALKGTLIETMKKARPTLFMGVPRVWEKMMEKLQEAEKQNNFIKRWVLTWAKYVGFSGTIDFVNGNPTSLMYKLAKTLVFDKIRFHLGLDRCRFFLVGGAPSKREVLEYFFSLGIPIMEAYGMSESTACHTFNGFKNFRLGSCGRQLDGIHTKVVSLEDGGEDGEVCFKGRNICIGYLNDEKQTGELFDDDGWLKSGDIGRFDEDGYFYITGRLKELIITSGGENIAPTPIEARVIQRLPCLSCCMLVGDKRKYLTMLLTFKTHINPETNEPLDTLTPDAIKWCSDAGCDVKTVSELRNLPPENEITKKIQQGIDDANKSAISNAQKIQKWAILPKDFSIVGGEFGPTLKLRRNVVMNKHKDIIERMYVNQLSN